MKTKKTSPGSSIVPVSSGQGELVRRAPPSRRLLDAFLSGRGERTMVAYRQDLEDFRVFVGAATVEKALETLLESTHGEANAMALAYRASLTERGLAPATINRRLSALRSMVKLGRTLGLVSWTLEVENAKGQAYRDTRGPGRVGFCRLLAELDQSPDTRKRTRDTALISMLFDLALRRGEAVSLDVEHLDLKAGTVSVLGKGRTQRVAITLPDPTRAVLGAWLEARGASPGPLFLNVDRRSKGGRLTGRSVARIVGRLGDAVGLHVRPHGLRHAAITEALDLTNGNVRAVQKFSRHRDLRTLTLYDDNRTDLGGDVAKLVAAGSRTVGPRSRTVA